MIVAAAEGGDKTVHTHCCHNVCGQPYTHTGYSVSPSIHKLNIYSSVMSL